MNSAAPDRDDPLAASVGDDEIAGRRDGHAARGIESAGMAAGCPEESTIFKQATVWAASPADEQDGIYHLATVAAETGEARAN
jgi:hypothetical protein